jgi:hypothetical protein
MLNNQDIQKALDVTLDWLSDQSEDIIRKMFSDRRIPRSVDFIWEIGGTEYTVISHFNQNAEEDIFNKVQRLLEDEAMG